MTLELTERDLRRAYLGHLLRRQSIAGHAIGLSVVVAFSLALVLPKVDLHGHRETLFAVGLLAAPTALFYLALLGFLVVVSAFSIARRQIRTSRFLSEPSTLVFDQTGVDQSNRFSFGWTGWDAILETWERPDFFTVYVSKDALHVLPKRCVAAADLDRLRALFAAKGKLQIK